MISNDLEEQLRDLVNLPRRKSLLLANKEAWNRICASMDVIGDTTLCMTEYLDKHFDYQNIGLSYLILYGILQSMFLQQDAIMNIANALNINISLSNELKEIREIRNNSIGHPVRNQKGKVNSVSFIIRPGITPYGFQTMSWLPNTDHPVYKTISVPELIKIQKRSVENLLSEILRLIKEEDMNHKEKFKKDKISDCFGGNFQYYTSKLYESVSGSRGSDYALIHVKIFKEILDKVTVKLKERGEFGNRDNIDYTMGQLEYPILKLTEYYTKKEISEEDAFIYTFFLDKKMNELRKMIEELDEEYNEKEEVM